MVFRKSRETRPDATTDGHTVPSSPTQLRRHREMVQPHVCGIYLLIIVYHC